MNKRSVATDSEVPRLSEFGGPGLDIRLPTRIEHHPNYQNRKSNPLQIEHKGDDDLAEDGGDGGRLETRLVHEKARLARTTIHAAGIEAPQMSVGEGKEQLHGGRNIELDVGEHDMLAVDQGLAIHTSQKKWCNPELY